MYNLWYGEYMTHTQKRTTTYGPRQHQKLITNADHVRVWAISLEQELQSDSPDPEVVERYAAGMTKALAKIRGTVATVTVEG